MFDYLKIHSECTILMQISQNFPRETPPPRDQTPSLSVLRASVMPLASLVTQTPGSGGSGSTPVHVRFSRSDFTIYGRFSHVSQTPFLANFNRFCLLGFSLFVFIFIHSLAFMRRLINSPLDKASHRPLGWPWF